MKPVAPIPPKPKKDRAPVATIVSRWVGCVTFKEAKDAGLEVIQAEAPIRILVPRGCKAEIFSVPEGTEIRIRYSSKVKTHGPGPTNHHPTSGDGGVARPSSKTGGAAETA